MSWFLKCLITGIAFVTIHVVKNIHMIRNLKFYLTSADQVWVFTIALNCLDSDKQADNSVGVLDFA